MTSCMRSQGVLTVFARMVSKDWGNLWPWRLRGVAEEEAAELGLDSVYGF